MYLKCAWQWVLSKHFQHMLNRDVLKSLGDKIGHDKYSIKLVKIPDYGANRKE